MKYGAENRNEKPFITPDRAEISCKLSYLF